MGNEEKRQILKWKIEALYAMDKFDLAEELIKEYRMNYKDDKYLHIIDTFAPSINNLEEVWMSVLLFRTGY